MPYTAEATLATFPAYSINTLNRMLPVNYLGQGRENRGIFLFHGQVIGNRTNPAESRADARERKECRIEKEKTNLAVFREHYSSSAPITDLYCDLSGAAACVCTKDKNRPVSALGARTRGL